MLHRWLNRGTNWWAKVNVKVGRLSHCVWVCDSEKEREREKKNQGFMWWSNFKKMNYFLIGIHSSTGVTDVKIFFQLEIHSSTWKWDRETFSTLKIGLPQTINLMNNESATTFSDSWTDWIICKSQLITPASSCSYIVNLQTNVLQQ